MWGVTEWNKSNTVSSAFMYKSFLLVIAVDGIELSGSFEAHKCSLTMTILLWTHFFSLWLLLKPYIKICNPFNCNWWCIYFHCSLMVLTSLWIVHKSTWIKSVCFPFDGFVLGKRSHVIADVCLRSASVTPTSHFPKTLHKFLCYLNYSCCFGKVGPVHFLKHSTATWASVCSPRMLNECKLLL